MKSSVTVETTHLMQISINYDSLEEMSFGGLACFDKAKLR